MGFRAVAATRGWGWMSLALSGAAVGAAVWGALPVLSGVADASLIYRVRVIPAAAVCIGAALVGVVGRWGARGTQPPGPGMGLSTFGMYLGRLAMVGLLAAGLYAVSIGTSLDRYSKLLHGGGGGGAGGGSGESPR